MLFKKLTIDKQESQLVAHVIPTNKVKPYMIEMAFEYDKVYVNYNFIINNLNYNYDKIEKNIISATEVNKNILNLVKEISSSNQSNGIFKPKNVMSMSNSGFINNIIINQSTKSDKYLNFNINSSLSELIYNISNQTYTPYACIKKDYVSIPMTKNYEVNPMKAVKDF